MKMKLYHKGSIPFRQVILQIVINAIGFVALNSRLHDF